MARESCAQTDYERFWRLAQEAYRAEFLDKRSGASDASGYYSAISFLLRASIRETTDECVTIARQMRNNIAPEMTGVLDPYYDGYVAGCDKGIHILQGGV
jgi:hypothetical protein